MELGLGIHGEPGARTAPLQPVDGIVEEVNTGLSKIQHGWIRTSIAPYLSLVAALLQK